MSETNDFSSFLDLIDQMKNQVELDSVTVPGAVTFTDVIRQKKDELDLILAYYKKTKGSGYREILRMFKEHAEKQNMNGMDKVNEKTLSVLFSRVSKPKVRKGRTATVVVPNSIAGSKPVTITNPVAMTKKVVATVAPESLPGAVPGDDDVIDWMGEHNRLTPEFKVGFSDCEWNAADTRMLDKLVEFSREQGISLSKLSSADLLPRHGDQVCSFQVVKARKFGRLPA
jgi:hypothetical protein